MADIVRKNPSEFLKTLIGRPVVVRLNSGVDYRGSFLFSYFFFLFLFPFSFSLFFNLSCIQECLHVLMDSWTLPWSRQRSMWMGSWRTSMAMPSFVAITVRPAAFHSSQAASSDPSLFLHPCGIGMAWVIVHYISLTKQKWARTNWIWIWILCNRKVKKRTRKRTKKMSRIDG